MGRIKSNWKTVNRAAFKWQISYEDFLQALSKKTPGNELQDEEVIYSVLGLLFGSSNSQLHSICRVKRFTVDSSRCFLSSWVKFGETVISLNNFLYPSDVDNDLIDSVSFSVGAFIQSLRTSFHLDIETQILNEAESFHNLFGTNDNLHDFLVFLRNASGSRNGVAQKVKFLYRIYEEIIFSQHFLYNFNCTSLLINTLYKYLDTSSDFRFMAWNMFLDVLRPTIKYLEEMLDQGFAHDPKEEFMFDLHDLDVVTEKDFWNKCISIRDMSEQDQEMSEADAVPLLLKPILPQLVLGIKSRLLLTACSKHLPHLTRNVSEKYQGLLWDQFLKRFQQLQEKSASESDPKKVSKTDSGHSSDVDSGEGDEIHDVDIDLDSGLKTGENGRQEDGGGDATTGDVSPDILDECIEDVSPKGPLTDSYLSSFPNKTPLDSVYYQVDDNRFLTIENPNFESLPDVEDYRVPLPKDHFRIGLKAAVEESLFSVLLERCSISSSTLISSFMDIYLKHLKFHTDYLLLQKPSHCISLYLDNLFEQITFPDSLFYKKINLEMHHFDDSADVRACIVYSSEEVKDSVKILGRLHILYEDLDPFSRLLIHPQVKQIFGDAFYFLIVLRYSKWILDSVQLKSFLPKKFDDKLSKEVLKLKHELFCLRFKCMRAVVGLLEYVMFQMHEAILLVNEKSRKAQDFNQLKQHLESFAHSVQLITLQDKKNVIQLIVSQAVSIHRLCCQDVSSTKNMSRDLQTINKSLTQIEAIVNLFVIRLAHSYT